MEVLFLCGQARVTSHPGHVRNIRRKLKDYETLLNRFHLTIGLPVSLLYSLTVKRSNK